MFKAVPIEMIAQPNTWAMLSNWEITSPNQVELWFLLQIEDQLGARRYIPAPGSTMQVVFQRADILAPNNQKVITNTPNSVSKAATQDTNDKSMYKFTLTPTEVQKIVSGTVKFSLTVSGVVTTWLQNWMIKKNLTDPGM